MFIPLTRIAPTIWASVAIALAFQPFPAVIVRGDDSQRATKLESSIRGEFRVRKVAAQRFCEFPSGGDNDSAGLCDLYLPQRSGDDVDNDARWPVVIAVHGGGWASGDKWTMDRHAWKLAEHGIAAVSINYRLAPSAQFPDQVDDVRSAMLWIKRNADHYGLDTQQVGLYGYSAGGHLVSLVATLGDESWDRLSATTCWKRDDPRWKELPAIRAVCAGGPPTDFRDLPPDNTTLAYFLGGSRREKPGVYNAASPICFVSPGDPPFQIVHGEVDGVVSVENSKAFHKALLQSNVKATLETLPRKGHLMAFISPQLTIGLLDFFKQHLQTR